MANKNFVPFFGPPCITLTNRDKHSAHGQNIVSNLWTNKVFTRSSKHPAPL